MKRRTYPAQKSGVSPYRKYDKRPYRYSDNYYRWKAGILNKTDKEVRKAS